MDWRPRALPLQWRRLVRPIAVKLIHCGVPRYLLLSTSLAHLIFPIPWALILSYPQPFPSLTRKPRFGGSTVL